MLKLTSTQRQLLTCLQVDSNESNSESNWAELTQLSPTDWETLARLAAEQRVLPLFYHRLKSRPALAKFVPTDTLSRLQQSYQSNAVRNLQFFHELGKVLEVLQAAQIPVILLKGAHLAVTVYDNLALRSMADVDMLVRPNHVTDIVKCLRQLGYSSFSEQNILMQSYASNHISPMIKGNLSIEVHHLITEPQTAYYMDVNEFWLDAQPIRVARIDTLGFSIENLLLHVCTHLTYQHVFEQGIRGLCDIDTLIRRYQTELDWQAVIQRAKAWHWQRGVCIALYLARHLLKTPIEDTHLQALCVDEEISQVAQQALEQFFSEKGEEGLVSQNFVEMWHAQNPLTSSRIFLSRLFLPKQTLADMYSISVDSPKIYLCYLYRLYYFLRQYWGVLRRLLRGEAQLAERIQRQNKLIEWLEAA